MSFTISLAKLPQTDAMVTVSMDGTDCTVNISAGEINSSVNIPNSSGANTITGTVIGISSGSLEAVDYSSVTATETISNAVQTEEVQTQGLSEC